MLPVYFVPADDSLPIELRTFETEAERDAFVFGLPLGQACACGSTEAALAAVGEAFKLGLVVGKNCGTTSFATEAEALAARAGGCKEIAEHWDPPAWAIADDED